MKKKILAILAHPDDETFGIGGTLAKYARENVEVHVAIATDGAAGSVIDVYEGKKHKLIEIREKELKKAAKVIKFTLHALGYCDSGYVGDPQNNNKKAFINANPKEVENKIVKLIRRIRPDIVITHDETGGYLHPDHIMCWKVVTPAFYAAGDGRKFKGAGKPFAPTMLYYTAFPKSKVILYNAIARLKGEDPKHAGRNKDIDMTTFGIKREDIHVVIDTRKYWDIKKKASAMHESQGGNENRFPFLPDFIQKLLMGRESYIRAYPLAQKGERHTDLFTL